MVHSHDDDRTEYLTVKESGPAMTHNHSLHHTKQSSRRTLSAFRGISLLILTLLLLSAAFLGTDNALSNVFHETSAVSQEHANYAYNQALTHKRANKPTTPGLTPQDLWKLYNLPGINGGEGQLIAEVIDGDIPTMESDLLAYSRRFGLPECTVDNGCLTIRYQGDKKIAKGYDPIEGILDVEIMHAIAPKAKILLYITHGDNDSIARGPSEIINTPGLRAINMSYGFSGNGRRYQPLYAKNPNHVALFGASGDDGYGEITPPSIYPEVIAVGGTVVKNGKETAWSGSGGGLSKFYPIPDYQKNFGIPRSNNLRGNPDIAAVGGTPIAIYEEGKWAGESGTSVSSPIWTGIAALVKKQITPQLLYDLAKSKPDSFNDIVSGTNGKCGYYCTARPGYDYVTGLGTPKNFVANVNAMK